MTNIQSVLRLQNSDLAKGQITDGITTADIVANEIQTLSPRRLQAGHRRVPQWRRHPTSLTSLTSSDSVQNVRVAGYLNGKRAVLLIIFAKPERKHH